CIQTPFHGRAPLIFAAVAASRVLLTMRGVRPSGQTRSSIGRRGERSSLMSDQFEVDTDELVEQLHEHQRLTGTEPRDESGGRSRGDLRVGGGAAAARVSGVGALAGTASAAPAKTGKYTGTLRVITLGVEWPTPEVQKKAEADLGVKFALTVTDPVTMVQK